jgi:hypothetical protein
MPSFIIDSTSLSSEKTLFVSRPDVPVDKKVRPEDWNQFRQALIDIQDFCRGAPWLGIDDQAADPLPTGIDNYFWVDDTGVPYLHTGGNPGTNVSLISTEATFGASEFGDGQDGTALLNGSTTVLGMIPVANVYTMTRDLFFEDLTIDVGVTLKPDGFRVFVKNTLTNNGLIHRSGTSASGVTAGTGPSGTSRVLGGGFAGGNGGNGGAGADGTATSNSSPRTTTSAAGNGGASASLPGTAGDVACRGGGGGRAGGGNTGSGGATIVSFAANVGRLASQELIAGRPLGNSVPFEGGSGGGGGAYNTVGFPGGGGGGGGGVLVVGAKTIAGSGAIEAKGGDGADGDAGNPAGGGGGGGGGVLVLVYGTRSGVTYSVAGGTAGSGTGGAGNGGDGATGLLHALNLSGDGT